jgi:UDP-2,3-diacylglucosamine pyrophosphatase LpxH
LSSRRHENLRKESVNAFRSRRNEAGVARSEDPIRRYRTIFLSDLHLGTRGCQAELALDFLRHNEADTYFLVGDILDGWRMRSSWYWPQAHNDVVQKLLRKVRRGARMIFVPGNHDEFARQFVGLSFGGIEIVRNAIHVTADGKSFLVMHGDEFDVVVRNSKWLAHFGDWAYDFALFVNTRFNDVRRFFGFNYWSFSAWAKLKVKNAVNFIGSFESELAREAKRRGVDGVVCGHIHHPTIREIDGVTYVNTGDFVESCSLVVEHDDGRLEVVRWSKTFAESLREREQTARLVAPAGGEVAPVAAEAEAEAEAA